MGNCNGKVKPSKSNQHESPNKQTAVFEPMQAAKSKSELHKLELRLRREEEERRAAEKEAAAKSHHHHHNVPNNEDKKAGHDSDPEDDPERRASHISHTLAEHRPPPINTPQTHSGVK